MLLSARAHRYNLWLPDLLSQMKASRFRWFLSIFPQCSAYPIFLCLPFFSLESRLYTGRVGMFCSRVDIQTNSLLVEGDRYDATFHTWG
jgi:hypothetical protein